MLRDRNIKHNIERKIHCRGTRGSDVQSLRKGWDTEIERKSIRSRAMENHALGVAVELSWETPSDDKREFCVTDVYLKNIFQFHKTRNFFTQQLLSRVSRSSTGNALPLTSRANFETVPVDEAMASSFSFPLCPHAEVEIPRSISNPFILLQHPLLTQLLNISRFP